MTLRQIATKTCDDAFTDAIKAAYATLILNLVTDDSSLAIGTQDATEKARAAFKLAIQAREICLFLCSEIPDEQK